MDWPPQIIIIGGSHGGLGIAKSLLNSLPRAKITLISTNKDYYFNFAAPRILARPDEVNVAQVLMPIEKLFKKYSESQFEFVHATVTNFDPEGKTVFTDDNRVRGYDHLVIASGTHTKAVLADPCIPVKHSIANEDLRETIPKAQKAIADALRIVVAGGGPVGIEMASEIAEQYPSKTIHMVFASFRLVDNLKEAASIQAGQKLNKLGIVVKSGTKVKSSTYNKANQDWTIALEDGTSIEADLYIPAVGVLPNNSFIPKFLLSKTGYLKTNSSLCIPTYPSVHAIGDIIDGQPKLAALIKAQTAVVAKNIIMDVEGREGGKRGVLKKPMLEGMVVPIGREGGTGQIGGFVPWNWMVTWMKGDYFLSKTDMFVSEK